MQQVQEVAADGVVVGLDVNAAAVRGEVVPVEQHGAERGHEAVGDVARAGEVVVFFFGQMQPRTETPVRMTSMGWAACGKLLERELHGRRQAAHGLQLGFVGGELHATLGSCAVDQQVGDFFELGKWREIENVVAAVMQVAAAAADGAERGVARGRAGKGDGLLGLEGGWGAL